MILFCYLCEDSSCRPSKWGRCGWVSLFKAKLLKKLFWGCAFVSTAECLASGLPFLVLSLPSVFFQYYFQFRFCNLVFFWSNTHTKKSLLVSAGLLNRTSKSDHITPILVSLHWLPICFWIDFNMLFLALCGQPPDYIIIDIELPEVFSQDHAFACFALVTMALTSDVQINYWFNYYYYIYNETFLCPLSTKDFW